MLRILEHRWLNVVSLATSDLFQRNTSLYPEIRSKRVRYREARLYYFVKFETKHVQVIIDYFIPNDSESTWS